MFARRIVCNLKAMTWAERTNRKVAESAVGRYFKLEFSGAIKERKGSRFLTEIRAGLAT